MAILTVANVGGTPCHTRNLRGDKVGEIQRINEEAPVIHRAHLGVECPSCHWKQFVEVGLDKTELNSPMAREIYGHLAAWMASHCPDHLNMISAMRRN